MNTDQKSSLKEQLNDYRFALSKVSHEIRNPVTLINSSLQMLEKEHPEMKQYDLWQNIMQDMAFLRELLDDLSSYNNFFHCCKQETDMVPWLVRVTDSIPKLFLSKSCSYCVQIPQKLSPASIDPLKLNQALTNLLRNAFEAAEHTVSFQALEKEGFLFFKICNDGACILAEQQKEIFRPFVTFKSGGTGLGLPIAKGIIETHGGKLTLTSSASEGTCVSICLPLNT